MLWTTWRVSAFSLIFFILVSSVTSLASLSDDTLRNLAEPGNDFDIYNGALLAPILKPRVPGSRGSTEVLQHFVDFFSQSLPAWNITYQNSTQKVDALGGKIVPFVNLIATRDPPWSNSGDVGRLALVAHYDSKMSPEGFIGATDSAAPCAMLMHAARSIDAALTKKWTAMDDATELEQGLEADKGIQIILLDGEEAFVDWTDTDSLYGSRSLAAEMEATMHPAMSTFKSQISSISLFLLLDLLGAKGPTIPSYFKTTHWAYKKMAELEVRLRELYQFKSSPNHPSKRTISSRDSKARQGQVRAEPLFLPEADKQDTQFRIPFVGDDHIPFMARGVDILHMIPIPFPRAWHKMEDDGEHLDIDTVEDWAKLVTAFAAEWMELEGHFDTVQTKERDHDSKRTQVISKTEL
jgi:glutaminyl-peptide cyclotransferase